MIQRFGSALNLNTHFHMLFLDGVYVEWTDGRLRFREVKAPTSAELTRLADTIARRVGRLLERQGLLERDSEGSWLAMASTTTLWAACWGTRSPTGSRLGPMRSAR